MKVAISSMVIPVSVIDSSIFMLETDSDRRYDCDLGEVVTGMPWAVGSGYDIVGASRVGLLTNGSPNIAICVISGEEW